MRTLALLAVALVAPLLPAQDRPPLAPADAKAAFLKLLDRPRVPADVREEQVPDTRNGLAYQAWSFASEKKADGTVERVPVLTVRPAKAEGKLPAVIVLHGTGGTKEGVTSWLEEFAKKGVVGVAIDARYHGARSGGAKGSAAYVAAVTRAWKTPAGRPMEHPFYYDTVWDLWRLVDVLQDTPGIDGKRVGMLGISMGGIQTWLAASVDDRVAVAAPLIGVQSFRWSLENDHWQGRARTIQAAHDVAAKDLGEPGVNGRVCRELWGKVIPGITSDFDCPNLLRLFAPRPLFIANGADDPNCPAEGARIAIAAARDAYEKAGAADRLDARIAEGVAHAVTPEHRAAAVAFCVRWLSAK
ncbi:acetylxylan esterase [bacterium]|nr:acetylxylan esterase [bacterium]